MERDKTLPQSKFSHSHSHSRTCVATVLLAVYLGTCRVGRSVIKIDFFQVKLRSNIIFLCFFFIIILYYKIRLVALIVTLCSLSQAHAVLGYFGHATVMWS